MATRRTVDLLPEIFRTQTNKQFLSATLDQLTQEPNLKKTYGFVGRRVGPGVNPADNYVIEPTSLRTDYQLEPGVVFFKPDTPTVEDAITYPGIIDALTLDGADTNNQDRLFQSSYYAWDPFCDLDKFNNYSQYYWLPGGPDPVNIGSTTYPVTNDFIVTRSNLAYTFSDESGNDPILTLVRGGTYTFQVNQPGNPFWIQAVPGINGTMPDTPNISSRDVLGVINNGEDQGFVTFNVPLKTAQDFYYNLPDLGEVDLITNLNFDQINNIYVSEFLAAHPTGIDGITNLAGRTLVFSNTTVDAQDGGWQITTQFDPLSQLSFSDYSGTSVATNSAVTYANISPVTVTGSGTGLLVDIGIRANANIYNTTTTTITIKDPGSNYATGDTIKITGDLLGGTSPANDLTLIVVHQTQNGQPGSFDTLLYDQTTDIDSQALRYSVWRISYVYDTTNNPYMVLNSVQNVPNLTKFSIGFGTQYASTQWYKNASGYFSEIPLLTATLNTLWYQDGTNPEIFGRIQLVDQPTNNPINIEDIIGAKNYTSPNGVVFTNGLKVQFRGPTYPVQYQDLTYYVEGVGTGPGLDFRVGFVDGEAYYGPYHVYNGQKMTGSSHSTTTFQQYVYDTVAESLLNMGAGEPAGAPLPSNGIAGATVGNGIKLLPVSLFVTPETYTKSATIPYDSTSYDSTPYDAALNAPEVTDYLTINRASQDLNAWSRSNRWFHRDVIQATANYNNQIAVFDNDRRAKRPIIEFRANLKLYNFGTQGKMPVDIIDFSNTDALSNVNGNERYNVDGYNFVDGTRVIFAADADPQVRNRVYQVKFIDPNDSGTLVIDLVPVPNDTTLIDQTVVSLSGTTQQGASYWFDGSSWIRAQQKTNVNQAPLFDVYDTNGYSLSDRMIYPSSTFAGTRLFGYALGGTSMTDAVLGFSLKFLNINNIGDIVFENYLYTDTFLYVRDTVSQTESISTGFVRQYIDRTQFSSLIGWQRAAAENRSRQVFRFVYDGSPLILDVPANETSIYAPLQIYVGTKFVEPGDYTYVVTQDSTVITMINLDELTNNGDIIEVQVISDQVSAVAYYEVPLNLENNPLNENSDSFTLGTIRKHYESIGENLRNIQGPINGANNTRDLGDILRYGDSIVQHSSPLALSGPFLRRRQFDVTSAIEFNSREYQKYKSILLDLASKGDYINNTPTEILDDAMATISLGKSDISPFYWSDMLPQGHNYTETVYTYTPISTSTFDTLQTYDYTSSNYLGLSVYLNGTILTRNYQYVVTPDARKFTISVPLTVGDVITVREYSATYGSYVPNTPSKMGLYPAYVPEIYVDESYVTPTKVIRGHDGSITVAFNDNRDQVLLEFETRIFNNIKIVSPVPISLSEVMPGQFRTTEYSLAEINNILSPDFLSWVGWNKLDYVSQIYLAGDPFTYNYSQSSDKLNNQPLLGAWRGIYNYFYDTITPNTTPWQMLGFSQMPSWWEDYYGPVAPHGYTSGNMVLWEDLSRGLVRDPAGEYVLPQYVRPGLLSVVPSDSEGFLLPPLDAVVGNFDATSFRRSWAFGDDGPVESAWRTSSAWPFAVMRLLALTKPAKFFSLFADRDRYVYNDELEQFLWDGRYRLNAKELNPLYGDGTSKASYINWIIDYDRQLGVNGTDRLSTSLNNIGVRLCWRMAAFSDKNFLKIYTERSTPNSLNASLLLPDESYQLLLYKNQPFRQSAYSSVVIQTVEDGYQVFGYNTTRPYFEILTSIPNGNFVLIDSGSTQVRVSVDHATNVTRVPYGFVFTNTTAVCDFLYSYGLLLEQQGFVFDTQENGYIMDWLQMCREFLNWSQQGWAPGSIMNLNPAATKISITQPDSVVDSLAELRPENLILNQNRLPLPASELVIERLENTFTVTSLTSNTINYLNVNFTAYEHMVVLDNVSIFADLIYDPVTGARQNRILASGWLSGDWNGTVNAPGFVLNQPGTIIEWQPNRQYTKGEIVEFKNEYWSASDIIQPNQTFDYKVWLKSDYGMIQQGLLPNAANSSDQLANAYSVYAANLEQEIDLFSFGLIGFRPRNYMSALNLDDITQVDLYQQFLGTKGTLRSAELFTFANLGKEIAQYDIYEYWAMLRSSYGATANRNYFELRLNQALLTSDPSLVQVILPGQTSRADQTVTLQDVWKTSAPLSSTNILPTVLSPVSETSLPSAGYVNLNDVDYTVFDIDEISSNTSVISQDIADFNVGSTVWIAKINNHDWGVYRAQIVPGRIVLISNNLNGRSLVQFNAQHGLTTNDILIIKFFDSNINGAYRVLATPSLTTVIIAYTFIGNQTAVSGNGLGFTLQSARVSQASDIAALPFANLLLPGSHAWVDDNGDGRWEVLEKINPFSPGDLLEPADLPPNGRFGASVSQGFQNLAAMIGVPGANEVRTYVKDFSNQYAENITLTLGTAQASGFGTSMDMGDQTWAIVGAPTSRSNQGYAVVINNPPTSNSFTQWQLLLRAAGSSNDEFGYSVAMSQDERWIYVGSPGANRVYAYGRVDIPNQSVSFVTNGVTNSFYFGDDVIVDSDNQLLVVLNNYSQILGADYTIFDGSVIFNSTPNAGLTVVIARAYSELYGGNGVQDTFSVANLYGAASSESVSVYVNDVIQRPGIDYTLMGTDIIFDPAHIPGSGTNIIIRTGTHYRSVDVLTTSGLGASDRFGHSVATSTDGRQIIVGCPINTGAEGRVYVFDRSVQCFRVTNDTQMSYTTDQSLSSPGSPISVTLNGAFLIGAANNNTGAQFSISGDTVTLTGVTLQVGDIIEVETNQFNLVQTIQDTAYQVNAEFGYSVDLCINNCSLYIGSPFAQVGDIAEAGHVAYQTNQSRVYGVTQSMVANPVLSYGDSVRVNDYFVTVSTPSIWNINLPYITNSFVSNSGGLFRAIRSVPGNTPISDTTYWQGTNSSTLLQYDIIAAAVPNVTVSNTGDIVFVGDGQTTKYNVGTIYADAASYTTLVYVANQKQTLTVDYTYNAADQTVTFVTAPAYDAEIRIVGSRLNIAVTNPRAATSRDLLTVLPGQGTAFDDLGFETYIPSQTIISPVPQAYAYFGKSLVISTDANTLVVGAPNGTSLLPTVFDVHETRSPTSQDTFGTKYVLDLESALRPSNTTFDSGSTNFLDPVVNSGAVYTFDAFNSANPSANNPRQFAFGQQIYFDIDITPLDQFGTALDYTTGVLLIGSPYEQENGVSLGSAVTVLNLDKNPAWQTLHLQQSVVDINLMDTVYMYDRISSTAKQYFDFFDPLQGRMLGAIEQNVDYTGSIDPAAYNTGTVNNFGQRWAQEHVGKIWWDTANIRFIDPNQDDIVYASRRWGQIFPGSTVDVYQWVASTVPPSQYSGPGTPRDTESYTVLSNVNQQGFLGTTYYFWVQGINTVNTAAKKTLSAQTVARYIESPRSSGISYIAPINSSTVAIYNGLPYISAEDTIIHIEYDEEFNDNEIHLEYHLIAQDRDDGFLTEQAYRKFLDSFCGQDTQGNPVPDPALPVSERYGVEFRPRQSMFVNRFLALQNYLTRANEIMAQYPLAEGRTYPLLESREPDPAANSGAWNKKVANLQELSYQDLYQVPVGYLYLVASDSTYNGIWTIYEVQSQDTALRSLGLVRVQTYDTRLYWQYINWYLPGYDPLTLIAAEVNYYADLATINVTSGSSVKVTNGPLGKYEIYRLDGTKWTRVALQDGTIEILPQIWDYNIGRYGFDVEVFDAQFFDQEPVIETRKIIASINEEIFTGDLAIERNRQLILMFNYILSEQISPSWLTKTSLIDVDHVIRDLLPYQIYRQDNQDFVLNYIQEVKPYHTQIRQFNLIYKGADIYQGTVTDFDVPAYWNSSENMFVSPVLDNTGTLSTTSSTPSSSDIWQTLPWSQWYQNYLLEIESVTVIDGGLGYTVPPTVTVTGDCITPAVMTATVNSAGRVNAINIIDPGSGYLTTAIITLVGGNGTGAKAVANMGNALVRNLLTTIKYDRYQYSTTIVPWQANVVYTAGTQVRYADQVWSANTTGASATFELTNWTRIAADSLSGVDRTMGFYAPTANEPGLDLALLISGVDYPGVQVYGPDFNQNTGFDVGNYDINPYDNISYGPEGQPTYDPAILDAIYESEFTDPYLGILPAPAYDGDPPTTGPNPIIVDGGAFVDTYSSHAPEELVPGAIFDTLDMRVYTTPGADWTGDGHGFSIKGINYVYTGSGTYSFADLIDYPAAVRIWNQTVGNELVPDISYVLDWVNRLITIVPGAGTGPGDVIAIDVYGVGGGNQIYKNGYVGDDVGANIIIPVQYSTIQDMVIFVNGVVVSNYTYTAIDTWSTEIAFDASWSATDYIALTVLGTETPVNHSWSTPLTQYDIADGVTMNFNLVNDLGGTNIPNIVVEINGRRARPAEGIEYIGNGSIATYDLPNRGGYSLGAVNLPEVSVYVDNVALVPVVDYTLDAWLGGDTRSITLTSTPANGSQILISVNHAADYYFVNNTLVWKTGGSIMPTISDILSFTTFNDTSQQNILTQVWQGPNSQGVTINEGYDDTMYDPTGIYTQVSPGVWVRSAASNAFNDAPGSFSYVAGAVIQNNRFDTGRIIIDSGRIEVTLNGRFLFPEIDFTVDGSVVEILGPVIAVNDVVTITSFTQSVIPAALAFRIFQDMRGSQYTYRITPNTTTELREPLAADATEIAVVDASHLSEPNLDYGIFGLITINGERISYRTRDLMTNTLSGLRRGTAGTGSASHAVGSAVYDIGIGNLLPLEYQDYLDVANFLGDGSTTTFVATDISVGDLDNSTEIVEAVQVYVGGILQTSGYTIADPGPLTVVFDSAPESGYQISIRVRRGLNWYNPGPGTASDGIPLQETTTLAARFIRGN